MKEQKTAFVFPGQGAQYPKMGQDFYENFTQAREVFEEANDVLGRDLSGLIFSASKEELAQTQNSQTSIFVVSAAILSVVENQFPKIVPSVCAGLSLGEYTALYASKRIDFASCLDLVDARGCYMNEACLENPGSMAVVMGLSSEHIDSLIQDLALSDSLWQSNFNAPGQIVLSGTLEALAKAKGYFLENGAKRFIPLSVQGAFHSPLMLPAKLKLKEKIEQTQFLESSVGIVMNASAKYETDTTLKKRLVQQLDHPVFWEKSVREMDNTSLSAFVEIGCAKTLKGLSKRMNLKAAFINIETIDDLDQLAAKDKEIVVSNV